MSEMIERVARAMCHVPGGCDRSCPDLDHRPCPDAIEQWGPYARAAIEALREFTDAMGDAGLTAFETWERGETANILPMKPLWRAMIDAALAEHHATPNPKRRAQG